MTRLAVPTTLLLIGALSLESGCRGQIGSPESPNVDASDEESLVGVGAGYEEDEEDDDESFEDRFGKLPELPPDGTVKEVCRGKGKRRKCKVKDSKPDVSAAKGVRTLMKGFRWDMDSKTVLDQLTVRIDDEYDQRMKDTTDPDEQDAAREWRRNQVEELAKNHIQFESAANHRWGVSIIQYDYADDENEAMIWVNENATLKKFYFFRDDELWKIVYAYSQDAFPGKTHAQVVEEKFKKWFGVMPDEKERKDPEGKLPPLKYLEWKAFDGERVRTFDMTQVHGSHLLVLVNGKAEDRIGQRLPNAKKDESFNTDVQDVLGGTDVCYDADGNMVENRAACDN
ncbi:MAG: hypothetical protein B7733_20130 [Myxococcales bacterium FL481]|nr:MAG: hypothetical protein B7733_20130 [Myxococcales bacterium FL481]